MKKRSFLNFDRPPLVDMIIEERAVDIESHIRTGMSDGADAFGIHMEWLKPEFRNEQTLKGLFSYLAGKPLYLTDYRSGLNEGGRLTDEQRIEELKMAVGCGATLIDLTADMFAPDPFEFTKDPTAVDRQRKAIDEFHALGAEVLMSSHIMQYRSAEEVLEIALEQQRRGADIAKIVTYSGSEEELFANFDTTRLLKRELKIPFLFLTNGPYCKLHRTLGPYWGVCMWLCVDAYTEHSSRLQPLLRSLVSVVRNFDANPNLI